MNCFTTLVLSSGVLLYSSISIAAKTDPVADAKKICHYQAAEKSGFDPNKQKAGNSTAKKTGAGAAAGTAVRAVQGKSLLKGAAIGAAAGAAVGGVKKNKSKKQAVLNESHYNSEYENCLRSRGLVPENIR